MNIIEQLLIRLNELKDKYVNPGVQFTCDELLKEFTKGTEVLLVNEMTYSAEACGMDENKISTIVVKVSDLEKIKKALRQTFEEKEYCIGDLFDELDMTDHEDISIVGYLNLSWYYGSYVSLHVTLKSFGQPQESEFLNSKNF